MLRGPGKETADAHQLQEGRVACERGCVGSGSLAGYAACVRPWFLRQRNRRGGESSSVERRALTAWGCVPRAVCLGRSACRVSPSSHAQALSSPSSLHLFLRSRRLPALLLASPHVHLSSSRERPRDLIYRRPVHVASRTLRRSDPPRLRLRPRAPPAAAVSHAAISGFHSIRQRGKVKPSATCHRPPTPRYSRASLP